MKKSLSDTSKELHITILGPLHAMNEVIQANRRNRFLGAKMKQEDTDYIALESGKQIPRGFEPINVPMFIEFHWYCKNKKKDPDNIASSKKSVLDGLQKSGIIKQDTWKSIIGFSDHFYIDKNHERLIAIIKY